jgi:hypothetical protein
MSNDHAEVSPEKEVKVDLGVLEQMFKLNEEYSEVEHRLIGRDQSKDQNLRNALSLLTKNEQAVVEIVESNILDAGCLEIAQALSSNTECTVLRLREVGMGGAGTVAIAEAVGKRAQMRELYLDDNDLSSPEAIRAVAKLIAANTNLRVLGLESNKIEADGMRVLCAALGSNSTLDALELSENFFGDRGITDLVKVLKVNTTLRRIKLFNDEISNVGALHLATLMASGECSCTEIAFSDNYLINADGLKQVQDALRYSDFEEVGGMTFRRKVSVVRPKAPLPSRSVPASSSVMVPAPIHSSTRFILFGLAALALGLGGGLLLATRQKKWFRKEGP